MFKKTWTVAAIAASISSAYASEHIQPLFTSLLPAEQQQALVSTPLALTTPNLQQINIDTFATKVFATEDKVWLLSDQGVSVLERTASGLVSRAKLSLQDQNMNSYGNNQYLISPNGKKVLILSLWQNKNTYTEVELSDDFKLAAKKGLIDSTATDFSSFQFYADNSFKTLVWNNGTYTAKYYSFTDNGISYAGAMQENYSQNSIYSPKTKTVFQKTIDGNYQNYAVTVFATKLNPDGAPITKSVKITNSNYYNFDSTFVYDEVTNKLILSGYQSAYTLDFNAYNVEFSNQIETTPTALFGRNMSFSGIISGDYLLANSNADFIQRTNSGYSYNSVAANFNELRDKSLTYNTKTQQLEFWALGGEGQGVTQYTIQNGQLIKGLSQNKTEIGFSNMLQYGYQISSPDSPLLFVANNYRMEVYKTDRDNKFLRLNSDSLVSNYFDANDKVVSLGNGFYLLYTNNQNLAIVKESEGNTLTLVHSLNIGSYFQSYSSGLTTAGNNIILKSDREIALFNFDGEKLNYQSKITNQNNELIKPNERTELVKLDNKVYLLQPENKRFLEININERLLSLKVAGKMPNLPIDSATSASDRLFVRGYYSGLVTLMKNTEGDLVPTAIDTRNSEMKFFKNRFALNNTYNSNSRNFLVNDAITGIWNETIVNTCCDESARLYVTNNTLLAYNSRAPQTLTTYKINSAPYLPKMQPTLKLNQGVKQTQDLKAVVVDDEKDNLSFSGSLPAGFAVDNAGVLSFDGTTAGAGNYTVSVSDGGLATDLRLPYSINAAPALEKALPTVTVNEKQQLSLELSEFFSDIEGQAISFSATPVKGFTLSKAGLLAGVPADTSSTELAFTATDSGSAVSAHKIVINVNAAPVWTNVASQSFTVGDTVKIELATAFSDREGNALTLQAANLPAGLTLTGNTISGAPTTSGEFKVSIQATDAGGAVGSGTMTITVNDKKSGGSTGPVSLVLLAALAMLRRRKQAATH